MSLTIKLPTSIEVSGKTYAIRFDPYLIVDTGDKGEHRSATQEIILQGGYPYESILEALLHELIHAVNYVYCANRIPEADINSLSEGLFQIWKQLGISVELPDGVVR